MEERQFPSDVLSSHCKLGGITGTKAELGKLGSGEFAWDERPIVPEFAGAYRSTASSSCAEWRMMRSRES